MSLKGSRRGAILSVSLVSGAALFLAFQGVVRAALQASVFRVDEVEAAFSLDPRIPARRYRLTPPTSIFHLDLRAVHKVLQARHPTMEVEEVRRLLPNRLQARLVPRKPAAQLAAGSGYYLVSDEGVVLTSARPVAWPHQVVVSLEVMKGTFRVGQAVRSPSLFQAMEVLGRVRARGGLAGHGLNLLEVKAGQMNLFLDSGLEVRLNSRHPEIGLDRLAQLLERQDPLLEGARYVDLRFSDPVIARGKGAGGLRVSRR
ncbi:MAG: hypothetical protein HYS41_00590 [Candidatus Omnitrophica bacterium]|nr:hypothetical protein [Candidatus Omnitrophota bacterium]